MSIKKCSIIFRHKTMVHYRRVQKQQGRRWCSTMLVGGRRCWTSRPQQSSSSFDAAESDAAVGQQQWRGRTKLQHYNEPSFVLAALPVLPVAIAWVLPIPKVCWLAAMVERHPMKSVQHHQSQSRDNIDHCNGGSQAVFRRQHKVQSKIKKIVQSKVQRMAAGGER